MMEDNRVDVPIELTDEQWYSLMKMAHERDITLNQLVEEILTLGLGRLEREQS
jgi:predicted DNA-binding ribbon-helix-helix protein